MTNPYTPDEPGSPEPDPWATTHRPRMEPPPADPDPYAPPHQQGQPYAQGQSYPSQPYAGPPYPGEPVPGQPFPANPYTQGQPYPNQQYPGGPYPGEPVRGQPYAPGGAQPPMVPGGPDANPFRALFDFSFTTFATPGLVKVVYILTVIAAVGAWLLSVLGAVAFDGTMAGPTGAGLVSLLFGWIPALLTIAFTRFVLEGIVALIRIHDRVAEIAEQQKGDEAGA